MLPHPKADVAGLSLSALHGTSARTLLAAAQRERDRNEAKTSERRLTLRGQHVEGEFGGARAAILEHRERIFRPNLQFRWERCHRCSRQQPNVAVARRAIEDL